MWLFVQFLIIAILPFVGGYTTLRTQGEPIFTGFFGQRFEFQGSANSNFHLFSDPFLSINSLFGVANPSLRKSGTVMKALGIRWENRSLTVNVESISSDKYNVTVMIDSDSAIVVASKQSISLFSCVQMTWSPARLTVTFGSDHKLTVTWAYSNTTHINTTYLNIDLELPLEVSSVCGGVLGQTASNTTKPSTNSKLFVTHDLLSNDAKTYKFAAHPILCATQPPKPRYKKTASSSHPTPVKG